MLKFRGKGRRTLIHVYMDDLRRCPSGFTLVRTVDECIELLRISEVDILSLDYDMGPGEKTGPRWLQPSRGKDCIQERFSCIHQVWPGKKHVRNFIPEQAGVRYFA